MEFNHYSVLLAETVEQLHVRPEGIYVDGTLGGGGHAFEVCRQLTTGHLYGIDQDDAAIKAAGKRLEPFGDKVTILRNNYCNMRAALKEQGVQKVDGIVLDLAELRSVNPDLCDSFLLAVSSDPRLGSVLEYTGV